MFEQAWLKFVRPPRLLYTVFDLGPLYFTVRDLQVTRLDIEIPNNQGCLLSGCYFSLKNAEGKQISDKAIVYCHGFNGCLVEAVKYARHAAEIGANFCCFDFQGAGNSEGEYITLGHLEQDDIQSVLQFLRNHFNIKQFVLWGRSMGASTILLHQLKYGSQGVQALVLDSPFQQLSKLAVRMARRQISVPKFIIKSILALVRRQILSNAHFDIDKIILNDLPVSIPAYFITSKTDTVVPAKQTLKVMSAYCGSKLLQYVQGDHNEIRTEDQLLHIVMWANLQFKNQLFIETPQVRSLSLLHRDQEQQFFQKKRSAQKVPQPNQQQQTEEPQQVILEGTKKPRSRKQSHHRNMSGIINGNTKSFSSLMHPSTKAPPRKSNQTHNWTGVPGPRQKNKIFAQHEQKTLSPEHRPKSPTWESKPRQSNILVEKYSYLLNNTKNCNNDTQSLQRTLDKYTKGNRFLEDGESYRSSLQQERNSCVAQRNSMFSNPAKNLKNNMQFELRNSQVAPNQNSSEDSSRYPRILDYN